MKAVDKRLLNDSWEKYPLLKQHEMSWIEGVCSQSIGAPIYFYVEEVMASVPVSGHLTGYNWQESNFSEFWENGL